MLILDRRKGQEIVIGGGITVTVARIASGRVKIQVNAPPGVSIRRGELRKPDERNNPNA